MHFPKIFSVPKGHATVGFEKVRMTQKWYGHSIASTVDVRLCTPSGDKKLFSVFVCPSCFLMMKLYILTMSPWNHLTLKRLWCRWVGGTFVCTRLQLRLYTITEFWIWNTIWFRFFAPHDAPISVKFGVEEHTRSPFSRTTFLPDRRRRVGMGNHKIQKLIKFAACRRRGDTVHRSTWSLVWKRRDEVRWFVTRKASAPLFEPILQWVPRHTLQPVKFDFFLPRDAMLARY